VEALRALGYRRAAIRVIPNGIPEPRPSRPREETRKALSLAPDDFVVVLVAALRPEKRAGLFVDAVARARAVDGRIRGVVVGDGPELQRVRALADGTNGGVVMTGERADVPDLMLAADAVCLTSYAEALPMAVLEAMAVGRPVIATGVGGIAEAVVDGETGLLVHSGDAGEYADAIVELAGNEERREAMGRAALARFADLYTLDTMVARYVAMLSDSR
jgi:glycosyltransferase involved in cell wall biosynthesis